MYCIFNVRIHNYRIYNSVSPIKQSLFKWTSIHWGRLWNENSIPVIYRCPFSSTLSPSLSNRTIMQLSKRQYGQWLCVMLVVCWCSLTWRWGVWSTEIRWTLLFTTPHFFFHPRFSFFKLVAFSSNSCCLERHLNSTDFLTDKWLRWSNTLPWHGNETHPNKIIYRWRN